jgi:putative glutathione S-transferase
MGVGVLIDGKWTDDDETYRKGGDFVRATTAFRALVTADGSSAFPAEAGRYHLYVAGPCPWCHRTMIFRATPRREMRLRWTLLKDYRNARGTAWTKQPKDVPVGSSAENNPGKR